MTWDTLDLEVLESLVNLELDDLPDLHDQFNLGDVVNLGEYTWPGRTWVNVVKHGVRIWTWTELYGMGDLFLSGHLGEIE